MGSSWKSFQYHWFVRLLAMPWWPESGLLGGEDA